MRKILITLIISLFSTASLADNHSGKIDLKGFFVGDAKAIFDEKGNPMTFVYDGLVGMMAFGGTSFGDNSSHYCAVEQVIARQARGNEFDSQRA